MMNSKLNWFIHSIEIWLLSLFKFIFIYYLMWKHFHYVVLLLKFKFLVLKENKSLLKTIGSLFKLEWKYSTEIFYRNILQKLLLKINVTRILLWEFLKVSKKASLLCLTWEFSIKFPLNFNGMFLLKVCLENFLKIFEENI